MQPASTRRSIPTTNPWPRLNRALFSARRLRELKAVPEEGEIEAIEPVERAARALQAPDMLIKELDEK